MIESFVFLGLSLNAWITIVLVLVMFGLLRSALESVQADAMKNSPGIAVKYPASERSSGKPFQIILKGSVQEVPAYKEL